jgi:sigma-B regulation protein RsbU (phosphoserine phosphatase)
MAAAEMSFLHSQLEERKRRLETALTLTPDGANVEALLREVDSALDRFAAGAYGLCEECHDSVERDRLLADPLIRYCLDHLTKQQRAALQRDLDLAGELQRGLLPPSDLKVDGWETSYHYAPLGPVSGDYCDLCPSDGQLFFVLGDVSGKGVAASMRMTQLHALFRSLIGMGLPLAEIVGHVNCFLCDSGLAGQYATLVCGRAKAGGEVEVFNAGHLPVIAIQQDGVRQLEATGFPLGMFREASFASTCLRLGRGEMLFHRRPLRGPRRERRIWRRSHRQSGRPAHRVLSRRGHFRLSRRPARICRRRPGHGRRDTTGDSARRVRSNNPRSD